MLFTDIEGSTVAVQALGTDRWEAVLERHSQIVSGAVASRGGVVVRTQGDSFFVVFNSPSAAVAAVAAIQRSLSGADWPHGVTVRVRMGLHTGEARPASPASGVDYVGFEVHRAARIAAAAYGGQVLLSDTTEALVRGGLGPGLALRELGEHRFKDLVRPQRIYQLLIDGLPDDFPPLRSLDSIPNNLPTQTTTFVGRQRELAAAIERLGTTRLLTLTGPGGMGKTRLALHLAAGVLDRYPDGAWFVELASVSDPAAVGQAVATAVRVSERPGRTMVDSISASLGRRELLLVLDNCEHVITACAELAAALLRSCPRVVIIATSREALNVPGETLVPVPSLRVPESEQAMTVDDLGEYEAVQLFVDRCTALQQSFVLTKENAADIVRICRRLDGVPLALELAAARVRVLSVAQVAQRLDDRFRLLTGGGRTVVARQQTLRALIDWSYDLLPEEEQVLFRRLAVFVRGWSVEAAEAVGSGDGIEPAATLDLLAHLVDKSLVVMRERAGVARFTMLETIREYAREKLIDSGEAHALRKRHFDHFARLAAETGLSGLSGSASVAGAEYENLRAALEWIEAEPASSERELLLAGGMLAAASSRGRIGELRRLLTAALERADPTERTPGRAQALLTGAILAAMQGDGHAAGVLAEEAVRLLRELGLKRELAYALGNLARATLDDAVVSGRALSESKALFEELKDEWGLAMMLFVMADAALERGDYDAARRGHTDSLGRFRSIGDLQLSASPLVSLGRIACVEGDYPRARALVEEALTIRQRPELDNPWQVAMTLDSLGEIDRCEGNPAGGRRSFERALGYGRSLGDDMIISWSLHNLGHVALSSDELATAGARFGESLLLRWRWGPGANVASGLAGMAGVALRAGALTDAAHLLGAVGGMLESTHTVLPPADEQVRRDDLAGVRLGLDDLAFGSAYGQGRAAAFDDLEAISNAITLRVSDRDGS